jgi:hypothetical protein
MMGLENHFATINDRKQQKQQQADADFVIMNDIMKSFKWYFKVLKNEGLKEGVTEDPVYKRFLGLAR